MEFSHSNRIDRYSSTCYEYIILNMKNVIYNVYTFNVTVTNMYSLFSMSSGVELLVSSICSFCNILMHGVLFVWYFVNHEGVSESMWYVGIH